MVIADAAPTKPEPDRKRASKLFGPDARGWGIVVRSPARDLLIPAPPATRTFYLDALTIPSGERAAYRKKRRHNLGHGAEGSGNVAVDDGRQNAHSARGTNYIISLPCN
jgi:hypothetical protein